MTDLKKAPSLQEIRSREEQKRQLIDRTTKEHAEARRVSQAENDRNHAQEIIGSIDKMFEEGRISSSEGGRLKGIPEDYITPGAKNIIEQYLGRDWSSSWLRNTGSPHDDDIVCTLVITPMTR